MNIEKLAEREGGRAVGVVVQNVDKCTDVKSWDCVRETNESRGRYGIRWRARDK